MQNYTVFAIRALMQSTEHYCLILGRYYFSEVRGRQVGTLPLVRTSLLGFSVNRTYFLQGMVPEFFWWQGEQASPTGESNAGAPMGWERGSDRYLEGCQTKIFCMLTTWGICPPPWEQTLVNRRGDWIKNILSYPLTPREENGKIWQQRGHSLAPTWHHPFV